jgi:hypothetical protein
MDRWIMMDMPFNLQGSSVLMEMSDMLLKRRLGSILFEKTL